MSASSKLIKNIVTYLDLDKERDDPEKIHQEIVSGISFRGTNLWILVFAIVVASVGLNMNSTAVIIGAMLISPLMGPINGMGYSIAIYDFELFRRALKNFLFAVLASLITSTTYFALSPVSTAYSELLARTSPSIYDVLIAFFGGLAGIVAIGSKLKGNVIPGVAIATALMPPLCTAGYGLATAQFTFFTGALYLFIINSVFIALSSVVISQFLKFPIRRNIELAEKKVINRWISIVTIIVFIPSIYFGFKLVQKEKFIENANRFFSSVSIVEGNYLLNKSIQPERKSITLVYGGTSLSDEQKNMIVNIARDLGLSQAEIKIEQGLSIATTETNNIEVFQLRSEVEKLKSTLRERDLMIDSLSNRGRMGKIILEEGRALFPQISGVLYSEGSQFRVSSNRQDQSVLIRFNIQQPISDSEKQKIHNWLEKRLGIKNLEIIYDR